jgi:transposase
VSSTPDRVVIGMNPHKRSATIEVMTGEETVAGGGRFGTDRGGYPAMVKYAKRWPDRVWAIEGCQGIGRHIALRLLHAGEQVVDVPPEAVGTSPRVRHRAGPQDRCHRCSLRRIGRHQDEWPAPGDRRRTAHVLRILVDRRRS